MNPQYYLFAKKAASAAPTGEPVPHAAPTNLTATESNKVVTASWTPNAAANQEMELDTNSGGWQFFRSLDAQASSSQFVIADNVATLGIRVKHKGNGTTTLDSPYATYLMSIGLTGPVDYTPGQLVITQPGTYTFNRTHTVMDEPTVVIQTAGKVRLENCNVEGGQNLIYSAYNRDVELEVVNCKGYGLEHISNATGDIQHRFLTVIDWKSLVVENCYFQDCIGIVLAGIFTGSEAAGQGIRIVANKVNNVLGLRKRTDGTIDSNKFAQFVQLRGAIVNGVPQQVPNVEIAWNQVHNRPGQCQVEDNINIFNFRGTPTSRMKIHHNHIKGAFYHDWQGNDYTGGGIIIDSAHTNEFECSRYIDVYSNHMVLSNNYSFGLAGGNNINFWDNRAVGKGTIDQEDADRLGVSGAGTELKGYPGGNFGFDYYGTGATNNSKFENNLVAVVGENSVSIGPVGWRNEGFYQGGEAVPTVPNINQATISGAITRATEDAELTLFQNRCSAAGITVGPMTAAA